MTEDASVDQAVEEMDAGEVAGGMGQLEQALREAFVELRDEGCIVEGTIVITKKVEHEDGSETIHAARISGTELDVPTYEDLVNVPVDHKTASETPPNLDLVSIYRGTKGEEPTVEEEAEATEKAEAKAEELGVDINEVQGTGADGKVTVADVERAAKEE